MGNLHETLTAPFPATDIEWRVQASGEKNDRVWARVLAYITSRAIMDRLDEAVGPGSWRNEFKEGPGGGVLCGISIKLDGEWVTKWDGAENTDIEAVKGGLSGAMKRSAVQWGIGRYLYNLDAGFANVGDRGQHSAKTKSGKWFKWDPPNLPRWALPGHASKDAPKPANSQKPASGGVAVEIAMIEKPERLERWVAENRERLLGLPSEERQVALAKVGAAAERLEADTGRIRSVLKGAA